jgi:signal transduction histidine kinase
MFRSLRSRLILASLLWTAGLLLLMHLLSLAFIHTLPSIRTNHAAGVGTVAGLLMLALGLFAAWASLTPLRRLGQKVFAVSTGEAGRIDGTYPSEVQPVIDRLNVMLEDRERAIARAQAAAGDLAHALKTPLALLMREADSAREAGSPHLADTITAHVRRMTAQVDRQLARARVAASGPMGSDRCPVEPCVDALVRTMKTLHADRALQMSVHGPLNAEALVRQEDLEEILGNVLDNACKWARSTVALTVQPDENSITFIVDDDGAGLPPAAHDVVLQRGVRLDERAPGSGLGLAIVRDMVEHYRGTVSLIDSPSGGLRVTIALPAARDGSDAAKVS